MQRIEILTRVIEREREWKSEIEREREGERDEERDKERDKERDGERSSVMYAVRPLDDEAPHFTPQNCAKLCNRFDVIRKQKFKCVRDPIRSSHVCVSCKLNKQVSIQNTPKSEHWLQQ